MQQRRVRLGDVLDDYCPRERRITNHAVVAMIEDDVKQTRCTTCDAEHEYKHAKIPPPRRKKPDIPAAGAPPASAVPDVSLPVSEEVEEADVSLEPVESPQESEVAAAEEGATVETDEEWPVHRPLIRATLPRPEGQVPERRAPDFTIRQNGGRFDGQRSGNRPRGKRSARPAHHGQSSGQSGFGPQSRSGSGHGSRHGAGHSGNTHHQGNRQGPASGRPHGGRPGHGGGQRPGQGRGPKRGR